ncbi:hypothetical protein D3C81_2185830 [compost metagenome]
MHLFIDFDACHLGCMRHRGDGEIAFGDALVTAEAHIASVHLCTRFVVECL